MTEFLLMSLYAPMASWGDITVGERRTTWDRPGRSCMLGLIAAAIGVPRSDQERHEALDRGYRFAVRVCAPGRPMTDYHTAQTAPASAVRKARPTSRKELLECGDLETMLSARSYFVDSFHVAALWATSSAPYPINAIAEALRRPHFTLYAGRKSNPFGSPLRPSIMSAATLADAFTEYEALFDKDDILSPIRPKAGWATEVARDEDEAVASGFATERLERRRDANPDRGRWQFAIRIVEVGRINGAISR